MRPRIRGRSTVSSALDAQLGHNLLEVFDAHYRRVLQDAAGEATQPQITEALRQLDEMNDWSNHALWKKWNDRLSKLASAEME